MRVWLVISSHRNDEDVMRILAQVSEFPESLFSRVLVVDSEGTGELPPFVQKYYKLNINYRCFKQNLGSGGNLCERLRLAAEGGATHAYALNHDGNFDGQTFKTLLAAAGSLKNLGAAYPLSFFTNARRYNLTGTRELPLPAKLVAKRPETSLIDVFWSSSNGALYCLEPVKRGVLPWPVMWMAWEDLEFGWRLSSSGYRQVIVRDAIYRDNYEYAPSWVGKIVDKPAWRTYYNARNLVLAVRRSRNTMLFHAVVCYRILRELLLSLLAKDSKMKRIGGLLRGTLDGWLTAIDRCDTSASDNEHLQRATPIPQ